MAMRKANKQQHTSPHKKATKASSTSSSSPTKRVLPVKAAPSSFASTTAVSRSTTTTSASTAVMSWKDAVQRRPTPPPSTPPQHATVSDDEMTSTKLAARSRSVSRIVQNATHRKRGVHDESSNSGVTTKYDHGTKQVSFCDADETSSADEHVALRSKEEAKRIADLVNRLGLNDPQQRNSIQPPRPSIDTASGGQRPRSASADSVLLRRDHTPPLWRFHEQPAVRITTKPTSSSSRVWSRHQRAMSVPNAIDRCLIKSPPHVSTDEDSSELDCDDTHSESTSDSSCPSPRHSPVTMRFDHAGEPSPIKMTPSASSNPINLDHDEDEDEEDEMDRFSDFMTPEDEEEQLEAFELLDRINQLSSEFQAHRAYEESSALAWSVQHAARQGVISPSLQQNLLATIRTGAWEEARDVLYHKCHLVPAVGSVSDQATTSSDPPPSSRASTEALVRCVDALAPTDSSDARTQKLHVLSRLSDLLTQWVKMVGYERGLSEEHVALTSGSLFLAGSYRLGLYDPLSDIDAVCVVPWHVVQDDFFSSFCRLLEQTKGVTQLAPVPHAYVPLISLSFLGVSLDLLFARLPMTCVEPSQEIDSDHMLVGVDPQSMKSLNAPRVSSMLLCLVPKRRIYRIVLRSVRTWARRRGIYSAKLGYLGGISWSILVAFVCQMYPQISDAATLLVRFFQVFSEWSWPRPVMLNMVYDAGLGFDMWDPRQNLYDRAHIMPIITPAYPHMNSAVQVSQSTFSVIYEELWRARYLAEVAHMGTMLMMMPTSTTTTTTTTSSSSVAPRGWSTMSANPLTLTIQTTTGTTDIEQHTETTTTTTTATTNDDNVRVSTIDDHTWDKLFQRSNFFIRYASYVVVNFYAETPTLMHLWGKYVQSRLRKLVDSLQHVSSVSRVHAFPCYFAQTAWDAEQHPTGSCVFIGVEFHTRALVSSRSSAASDLHDDVDVRSNLERTIRFFLATDLQQLADRHESMGADAKLIKWAELPDFVFPNGRNNAMVERAEYHQDMEQMVMAQQQQQQQQQYQQYRSSSNGAYYGRRSSPSGGRYGGGSRGSYGKTKPASPAYHHHHHHHQQQQPQQRGPYGGNGSSHKSQSIAQAG